MGRGRIFTRTIWVLGFVSLFSDIASEMLYPVMPFYLQAIGFSALWIGILEGIAEAVVGLSKGYFGKWSDERGKRLPFISIGYLLSGVSKSMMALFSYPLWILFARISDRFGKGVRTGARDAMLSDECSVENKGKVFGFHRAMDTLGAALGPVAALVYLSYHPENYKPLFLLAFFPSMLGVFLTFIIKEKSKKELVVSSQKPFGRNFLSYLLYWKQAPTQYRRIVIGFILLAIVNSSDIFLLLMAKHVGISDQNIILVYIFYNLIYALFALPFGHLADKVGMKKTILFGVSLFCIVYSGTASVNNVFILFGLFLVYGLYMAATEGVSKAWISKIALQKDTATAIGFFSGMSSIAALVSGLTAGLIWELAGPQYTFLVSGAGAFISFLYFALRTE